MLGFIDMELIDGVMDGGNDTDADGDDVSEALTGSAILFCWFDLGYIVITLLMLPISNISDDIKSMIGETVFIVFCYV